MNQMTKTIVLETRSLLTREKNHLACRCFTFKSMRALGLEDVVLEMEIEKTVKIMISFLLLNKNLNL